MSSGFCRRIQLFSGVFTIPKRKKGRRNGVPIMRFFSVSQFGNQVFKRNFILFDRRCIVQNDGALLFLFFHLFHPPFLDPHVQFTANPSRGQCDFGTVNGKLKPLSHMRKTCLTELKNVPFQTRLNASLSIETTVERSTTCPLSKMSMP